MAVVVVAAYGVVDRIDSEEDDRQRIVGDDDYCRLPYILLLYCAFDFEYWTNEIAWIRHLRFLS